MMEPITNKAEIEKFQKLIHEISRIHLFGCDFDPRWMRAHGWKVVPVESGVSIIPDEIAVIVPALRRAGYRECFAVATEPVDPSPSCYRMSITVADFKDFNARCGYLRYALMDEKRSWAISCSDAYNLLAAEPALLEAMLGKSIDRARQEYLEYATPLIKLRHDRLPIIARLYDF